MKVIYLIPLLLFLACASTKDNGDNINSNNTNSPNSPKIIFLNYKVTKSASKNVQLDFINKIIANGKIKVGHSTEVVKTKGDLMCFQFDKQSMLLDSLHLKNPLISNVEYVDADGNLGRKTIELDSADLSFRMQLHPQTKFLSFDLINNPSINLTKLDL
jgi:hypothetical protein